MAMTYKKISCPTITIGDETFDPVIKEAVVGIINPDDTTNITTLGYYGYTFSYNRTGGLMPDMSQFAFAKREDYSDGTTTMIVIPLDNGKFYVVNFWYTGNQNIYIEDLLCDTNLGEKVVLNKKSAQTTMRDEYFNFGYFPVFEYDGAFYYPYKEANYAENGKYNANVAGVCKFVGTKIELDSPTTLYFQVNLQPGTRLPEVMLGRTIDWSYGPQPVGDAYPNLKLAILNDSYDFD